MDVIKMNNNNSNSNNDNDNNKLLKKHRNFIIAENARMIKTLYIYL